MKMVTYSDLHIQFQKETGYSLDKVKFMVKAPALEYTQWLEAQLLEAWNSKN